MSLTVGNQYTITSSEFNRDIDLRFKVTRKGLLVKGEPQYFCEWVDTKRRFMIWRRRLPGAKQPYYLYGDGSFHYKNRYVDVV